MHACWPRKEIQILIFFNFLEEPTSKARIWNSLAISIFCCWCCEAISLWLGSCDAGYTNRTAMHDYTQGCLGHNFARKRVSPSYSVYSVSHPRSPALYILDNAFLPYLNPSLRILAACCLFCSQGDGRTTAVDTAYCAYTERDTLRVQQHSYLKSRCARERAQRPRFDR